MSNYDLSGPRVHAKTKTLILWFQRFANIIRGAKMSKVWKIKEKEPTQKMDLSEAEFQLEESNLELSSPEH